MFEISTNSFETSNQKLAYESIYDVPIRNGGVIIIDNTEYKYDKVIILGREKIYLFENTNSAKIVKLQELLTQKNSLKNLFSLFGINIILEKNIQMIDSLIKLLVNNLLANNSLIGLMVLDDNYHFLFLCIKEETQEVVLLKISNDGDIEYFNNNIVFATTLFKYVKLIYDLKDKWVIYSSDGEKTNIFFKENI
jgi:hypothetical protein